VVVFAALVVIVWIGYGVILERLPPGSHVLQRRRLEIPSPPYRDAVLAVAIFAFMIVARRLPRPPQGRQGEGDGTRRRRAGFGQETRA
jgi:hypothetical protein